MKIAVCGKGHTILEFFDVLGKELPDIEVELPESLKYSDSANVVATATSHSKFYPLDKMGPLNFQSLDISVEGPGWKLSKPHRCKKYRFR